MLIQVVSPSGKKEVRLRLRKGKVLLQRVPSPKFIRAPKGKFDFYLPNPRPFWYEAHCVLHEPLYEFDEDLTGRLLIVEMLAGAGQEFWFCEKLVYLLPQAAVLAVIEERENAMTKSELRDELTTMINTELSSLADSDQVSEENADSLEAAVEGILERVRDDANAGEGEEDEDNSDELDGAARRGEAE